MGTTFDGIDIVDVGVNVFGIVGIVHHGNLNGDSLLFGLQIDYIVEKVGAMAINVAHKLFQTVFGMEYFFLSLAFFVGTHVAQRDGDTGIQISQLAHTLGDDVILVDGGGKDIGIGPELLASSGLIGVAHNLNVVKGLALLVFLLVDMTIAEHL